MTRVLFNVTIIDDRILESSEKFQLTIISESLPNRVRTMPKNSNEVTVTIVDDDCKLCNMCSIIVKDNHYSCYHQLQSVNI